MPHTILLAQAEPATGRVYTELLRNAGYEVCETATGTNLLQTASERQPALIIVALPLPEIDGFALCKRLKTDSRTASIPVLLVSSQTPLYHDYPQSLESGAEAYLPEPVDPQVLTGVAATLIRKRAEQSAPNIIEQAQSESERKRAETALRESEERFRVLTENLDSAVALVDEQGAFRIVNRCFLRLFELPHDADILNVNSHDWAQWQVFDEHGSLLDVDEHPVRKAAASGIAVKNQLVAVKSPSSSDLKWLLVSAEPVFDAQRNLQRLICTYHDVTDRKAAEKALRESEERLRVILENSRDGINMLDLSTGRYVFMSPAQVALTGFTAEEINNISAQEAYERVHPEDREIAVEQQRLAVAGHDLPIPVEYRWKVKSGEYRWFSDSRSLVRDRQGRPVALVGISRDITGQKRAEQALRESEERFRTLANAIPQLCWMANADGGIFWYNQRWYDYTGATSEQMQGWGWQSVHDPETLPRVLEQWKTSIATGQAFDMIFPLRGADGIFRPFLTRTMPVLDRDGKVARWFGTNTDISEQLENEKALRRSNQDLEQFAYAASHDLQEPLRMISIYTEILARKFRSHSDQQTEQYVEWTLAGVQRMRLLLQALLDYSRVNSTEFAQVPAVDSTSALKLALDNLRAAVEESGASIICDPLPRVIIPEAHLVQLFQNLIGNAIRYRSALPPHISVSAARNGTGYRFAIGDNGIGIDPKFSEHIFGVFKRLHTGSESGTGIGLAICKRIVERWGGRIWVESALGHGATFYFTLPAAHDRDGCV